MKYKVAIFDWDGTLVNSVDHIAECLELAARACEINVLDRSCYADIVGLGMIEAIQQLYPAMGAEMVMRYRHTYSEFFFQNETSPEDLFDDVDSGLRQLRNSGYGLAVATSKSRRGLNKALKSTLIGELFDLERCADETRSKPDPLMLREILAHYEINPKEAVMVGDTVYDMEMAEQLGMDRVAVCYGGHDEERLVAHQPVLVANRFAHVVDFLMN